jgi:capsid portal protein
MTDAAQTEADIDALRKALKESKGVGEFQELVRLLADWQEGRNSTDPGQ